MRRSREPIPIIEDKLREKTVNLKFADDAALENEN
jgi:hypothetical protein